MNYAAPCPPNVVALHPDPIIRAGVVAALRRHTTLDVVDDEDVEDDVGPCSRRPASVLIAEHAQAMRMAEAGSQPAGRDGPATRTLVLTANDREADIRRAIEAGVHGYILIGGPLSDLIEGVEALACGRRYLARPVAQRMAESMTRMLLTSRETDVLQLVATGESNKGIGRKLGIELGTVKSHVTSIMAKLDATSRTQAAAIALAQGLA